MLSKSRCPHTGVVNFFTHADPLLSVGSVAAARAPARYVWRCYVGEEACGVSADLPSAEASLRSAVVGGERKISASKQSRKGAASALPSHASSYWQKLNDAAAAAGPRTRSLRVESV